MARRAKEPNLGAGNREHEIIEALDGKRRQLDREIAEFKADKEHEYRVFERQLRGKSKENDPQDTPQSLRKRGRSRQKNAVAEAGPMQKGEDNYVQRELDDGGLKGPDTETEDLVATARSNPSPGGSPGPPDRPMKAMLEREEEFQKRSTPSYLPLVGDAFADEGCRSRELLRPPSFSPRDLAAVTYHSSAMFSSSAETVHPPMTSPPLRPVRPLSSSVPPEKPSHHRRDSSRSDTSIASLRSSLRDPKQPRSPKRVLFSIDDTLVSPSTSPIARRSNSTTPIKPADSIDATGGFEIFEVVRNQNSLGPAVNRSQSNGVGFSSSSAPAHGWMVSLSTFGRAAELNLSKLSPSASGADDFEHLETDDLFTFDEDIGWAGKNKPRKTDPEDEYDEDVEVDEKLSKDPLTASSPHAGSLPIEIKGPGRREGRG
ncbi:MAG: hypothetical protein ALECFALPRED_007601 [Alectoria fallacina]|uniref:Uncharacterized protein n=1 Tax=Alectoria fallacina TaxID=1903189 RepID=A0A8H3G7J7_9LECA|nr:MAG: hypothetical protein ALECFALPRED_007601 [Alectoria fallacina]